MAAEPKTQPTPEEYLASERKADMKSEYYDGVIVAMTGATRMHNLILSNVIAEIRQQLKGRPCEVYPSDMRVKVPATGLYVYPDVTVVCDNPQFDDSYFDTLLNPAVIVEVLSDSTEMYDRVKKFKGYRSLESLAEYLLIAQYEMRVEKYVRQPNNLWLFSEATSVDDVVRLDSIECSLALKEIYDKIVLGREQP